MTFLMIAPAATPYAKIQAQSGTNYAADANGIVAGVALADLPSMTGAGWRLVGNVALWSVAGAPSNGTSGTLAGDARAGDLLVDLTNKTFYQNTNTGASPTWTALTTATGAGTYTGNFDGIVGASTPAAGHFTSADFTGYTEKSVGNALTAAGTNRATGLQLAKQINNVTTAATGTGVILPVGVIGMEIDVYADSGIAGAAIQVYASASETIDTVAGATGVVLTKAKRARFTFVAANTWISAQFGVISA